MRAADLVIAEICTPQCLLALMDEELCTCRCDGQHHGELAGVEVEASLTGRQSTAVRLRNALNCPRCGSEILRNSRHYLMSDGGICCGSCVRANGPRSKGVVYAGHREGALALRDSLAPSQLERGSR